MVITTHVTFGGYSRSRGVEATWNRKLGKWVLQPYWTDGRGGRKYDKPDGRMFATKREAMTARAADRAVLEVSP